ncbi:MAG: tRNA (N6-isopentenyl adenosine(37)-C2)-methylthiotransferase MiaB [Nitrospirae bacterium]|nr:tRNA (N6-isopentenyl adenosine(37)-C2)-methylthiotransferase MiaB [Nitrospirota bacterium]
MENMRKVHIKTWGCQMNEHDSERIAGVLSEKGYQLTGDIKDANLVILNTCSVRDKAEHKFFSEVGRIRDLKKEKPDLLIGVGGCIAQQKGEEITKMTKGVDLVFGTRSIHEIPKLLDALSKKSNHLVNVAEHKINTVSYPALRKKGIKAWVSIMYGCNNFCAYCVVPYTRGREESRPKEEILKEVQNLANQGFKEIMLLGQNVNSYGCNNPPNPLLLNGGLKNETDFPALLSYVHIVEGIERIRFMTSHPKDLSDRLIDAMAELPKVCNHLHLPLQSGSDRILKLMNRGYTYPEYKRKIDKIRDRMPEIGITTDIIAGFPGETEDDLNMTLDALRDAEYDNIYAFKYSKRQDTAAERFDGHLPKDIKEERLAQVMSLQAEITTRKNKGHIGLTVGVLVEGVSEADKSRLTGRTATNRIVNFTGSSKLVGKLINVKILNANLSNLEGVISKDE